LWKLRVLARPYGQLRWQKWKSVFQNERGLIMALLFQPVSDATGNGGYVALRLTGDPLLLTNQGVQVLPECRQKLPPRATLLSRAGANQYVVMGTSDEATLAVNGYLIPTLRVLRHKDEILVENARYYFSAESPVEVREWSEAAPGEAVLCARCHARLRGGDLVAACPSCGAVCHESEDLACLSYEPECPRCGAAISMDSAKFSWTPEELEG
jgi:hypothetical protein